MILCALVYRTGHLGWAIGMHGGWVAALKVSDWVTDPVQGRYLFGFGDVIYAGLWPSVVLVCLFVVVWFKFRRV
jgi:hypothetical protein